VSGARADQPDRGERGDKPERVPGKRLFVGIRVSVQTANALAATAESLQRRARDAGIDVKWVAPANYHATLKFLGFTRDDAIGAVRDALDEALAGIAPLTFRTARLGAFPSLDKASVLWAGIDGRVLDDVARRVDDAMAQIGFTRESRAFHAHVTLGRLRETRSVRDLVLPLSEQMFSDTRADGVTLFESETKATGSVYRDLYRIVFKARGEALPEAEKRQTGAVELGDETQTDTDDGWPRGHSH
jgi:RNA 2',3'-cyclic 3'-phosphodiesterase